MKKYVLRMKRIDEWGGLIVQRRYFWILWLTIARFGTSEWCTIADSERHAQIYIKNYCDIVAARAVKKAEFKASCKRLKTPVVVTCDHVNNV